MHIYEKDYFFKQIVKVNENNIIEVIENKDDYYKEFKIPKKNGFRIIHAIEKDSLLYNIQRDLNKYFNRFPISNSAKGFKKGESYFDFLIPHLNKKYYFRIDIKDFFGSIRIEQIYRELISHSNFEDIVKHMINLITLNDKLPQGAVTSPVISNIVFSRVDQRILKYCQSLLKIYIYGEEKTNDIVYTRYADDMLFSSNYLDFKRNRFFLNVIKKILYDNGYELNYKKIKYGNNKIVLSGFVIGNDIHLSRKKMNELNAILYYFDMRNKFCGEKYKIDEEKVCDKNLIKNINSLRIGEKRGHILTFNSIFNLVNYLCGYRSFLISINKVNILMSNMIKQNQKKIIKLEKLIDRLTKEYNV